MKIKSGVAMRRIVLATAACSALASGPSMAGDASLAQALGRKAGMSLQAAIAAQPQLEAEVRLRKFLAAKADAKSKSAQERLELARIDELSAIYMEKAFEKIAAAEEDVRQDYEAAYPEEPLSKVKAIWFAKASDASLALAALMAGSSWDQEGKNAASAWEPKASQWVSDSDLPESFKAAAVGIPFACKEDGMDGICLIVERRVGRKSTYEEVRSALAANRVEMLKRKQLRLWRQESESLR